MDVERREFRFPLSDINDLKVSSNDYHVEVKEDPARGREGAQKDVIQDVENRFVHSPLALYEHDNFDPLYMFVCKLKDLKASVKEELVNILCKAVSLLLAVTRQSVGTPDAHQCRNGLKMSCYLLCVIVRTIERGLKASPAQSKKKKQRSRPTAPEYDWTSDKEKIFGILTDVLSNDYVPQLWEMNTPEEEFGNLFFTTTMSAFDNQVNHERNSQATAGSMYRVIGLSLAAYRCNAHAESQLIRLMQTAQWKSETKLAKAVAELVAHVANEHNHPSLLHKILAEISSMNGQNLNRDTRGTKVLALFLQEIAHLMPMAVLAKLSPLLQHLEQDSYLMRNGVVSMVGQLIEHAFEDESAENRDSRNRQRHRLFDLLEERVMDISSYTRSRVLQTWTHLVVERLVPAKRICNKLIPMGRDRLFDKSSIVRKQAIHMLTEIIEHNPWGTVELVRERVDVQLEQLTKQVEAIEENLNEQELRHARRVLKEAGIENLDVTTQNELDAKQEAGNEVESEVDETEADEKEPESDIEMEDPQEVQESEDVDMDEAEIDGRLMEELKEKRKHLAGLNMLSAFTRHMDECVNRVGTLLSSKTNSDVLECISFFKVASEHKIGNEEMGFQKMLPLVWNKEKDAVRNAVLSAYHCKYIGDNDEFAKMSEPQQTKHALSVAASLVKMANGSTLAEITCIEELVRQLVSEKEEKFQHITIPDYVFSALWGVFEGKVKDVTIVQRRGALDILRMAAMAEPSIIVRKVRKVVEIGLGDDAEGDCGMARSACMALQSARPTTDEKGRYSHLPDDLLPVIWEKTQYILRGGFIQSKHWFATAQEAINLIFALHPTPDSFISEVIKNISRNLFMQNRLQGIDEEDSEMKDESSEERATESRVVPQNRLLYQRYALAKFLFILGNVAIKLLVHIEKKEAELKKMKSDREENDADNDAELIESLGGAGVEEYEIEQMKLRAEQSLVSSSTLLGKFAPLILRIVTDPKKYSCPILQNSAVLAFCKYMCISAEFCDRNLQSLFTLLKNHENASIRANIIIALGDMAFRFPNELDPWADHLYKNLRDPHVLVRKNTLMVLTHLILNDMIKVRDSICGIALLLLDEVAPIRDLARLFFQELSKKGKNPIYNILPDTISRLSQNPARSAVQAQPDSEDQKETVKNENPDVVSEETFQEVMKFLLSFIQNDRQKENLVEKLLKRLGATELQGDEKKWRNLAFCLAQFQYSEKVAKKITDMELMKHFGNKLHEDTVYKYFKEIAAKCKKSIKPDFKENFDEWFAELEKQHALCKSNMATEAKGDERMAKTGRKRRESSGEASDAPPKKKRRVTKRRDIIDSSSEESDEENNIVYADTSDDNAGASSDEATSSARSRGAGRGKGRGKGRKSGRASRVSRSDSENEDQENTLPPQRRNPRRTARKKPNQTRDGPKVNRGKRGMSSSSGSDSSGLEVDTDSD